MKFSLTALMLFGAATASLCGARGARADSPENASTALLVGGASAFALSYGVSLTLGLRRDDEPLLAPLRFPVVGPVMSGVRYIREVTTPCAPNPGGDGNWCGLGQMLGILFTPVYLGVMLVDVGAQDGGLAAVVAGGVARANARPKEAKRSSSFTWRPVVLGSGVGLAGTW